LINRRFYSFQTLLNCSGFVLLTAAMSSSAYAQFNETIQSDRPGQAIGAFTVGKNTLQLQQGVDYNSFADRANAPKTIVSNNVIRFGIRETIELSALIDYQYDKQKIANKQIEQSGFSNLHLGFKVHLTQQKGILPNFGFQLRLRVPQVSKAYGIQNLASEMSFVANWSLNKNYSLSNILVLSYNGNHTKPTGKYVLNFGFTIYQKLSGFIENYGQLYLSNFETRFDGGIAYLLHNNIQLDLAAGYGSNNKIKDYFISTGISWRILSLQHSKKQLLKNEL
jgi:hypothetical protein